MLPTVLSRCLQFNLRPMAPEVVRGHLAQVLQAEGLAFDEAALRLLGRAARGSMRDALSLTDQAIAYGGGQLDEGVVRSMLGSVDRSHAAGLVQALAGRDAAAVLALVDQLRTQGLSAAATLEETAALLQQMAVLQAVPDALDAADPDHADALHLAPLLAADETQLLYSMLLQGRAELSLMSDEHAALTMVLLRFLAFPAAGEGPPVAVRALASSAAPKPAPSPAPAPAPAPAPTLALVTLAKGGATAPARPTRVAEPDVPPWIDEGPPPDAEARTAPLRSAAPPVMVVPAPRPAPEALAAAPQTTALGDRWAELVQRLSAQGRIAAMVRELAWQAGVRMVTAADDGSGGTHWTLVVERDSLRSDALRDRLASALSAELDAPQSIEIEVGVPGDSVARRDAWERQRRQSEAEQQIHDDPAVQSLLAQFKTARIVPGTVKPL
jgi:DNA polymerase-3 subunit gamma/tau